MKKTWMDTLNMRNIRTPLTWAAVIVFILSLFPVIALAGVDRASGDDWSFGLLTHLAWVDKNLVLRVLQAGVGGGEKNYTSW